MSSRLVRAAVLLIAGSFLACHDAPQAPTTPTAPEWARLTMDDAVTDYPSWGGLDLLSSGAGDLEFVSAETEYGSLHFGACFADCDVRANWTQVTLDSGVYRGIGVNASSVETGSGITIAYEDFQTSTMYVKILSCAADCTRRAGWTGGDIRAGTLGPFEGSHSRALAADSSGGLHLLYRPGNDVAMYYAECASACGDSASWRSVLLDSAVYQPSSSGSAIAVTPTGAVHVLLATPDTSRTLRYLTCASSCTDTARWTSLRLEHGSTLTEVTPSITLGPDGRIYATYGGGVIHYATCMTNCVNLAGWTEVATAIPAGTDVALRLDGSGTPWIASSFGLASSYNGHSVVAHCASACLSADGWTTAAIDSLGNGLDIALVVDAAGPHVMVSGLGVNYAQHPDSASPAPRRP